MTAACALSPEMVTKLFWDVAWALEVLKDPQVILSADKFGTH